MFTSMPLIIILGLIQGVLFGRYYAVFYMWVYKLTYQVLVKILSDIIAVIGGFLLGCAMMFVFAIWGLVFSFFISDALWVYFSKSYFLGILVGMILLGINNRSKKKHQGY